MVGSSLLVVTAHQVASWQLPNFDLIMASTVPLPGRSPLELVKQEPVASWQLADMKASKRWLLGVTAT
jgi:hypothetical protein